VFRIRERKTILIKIFPYSHHFVGTKLERQKKHLIPDYHLHFNKMENAFYYIIVSFFRRSFMSKLPFKKSFILRLGLFCLAMAIPLLKPSSAQAVNYYWSVTNGDWSDPHSWGGTKVPTAGDNVYIANDGTANITQSESFWNLTIGYAGLGTGYVNMTGGTLSPLLNSIFAVGYTNDGTFDQSGGIINAGINGIHIGTYSGVTGTYRLSGTAVLNSMGYELIGLNHSTGKFTQDGGVNSATFTGMKLGVSANSVGIYTLNDGSLNAIAIYDGEGSTGTFNQNGGAVTISASITGLTIANGTGSTGTYNLNGGTLTLQALERGSGNASFNFGGGTLKAAAAFTSSLDMNLSGIGIVPGTLYNATVDTASVPVTLSGILSGVGGLNKSGSGTLTLSNANTYASQTKVLVGTLSVTGSLNSTGSVVVNPGAILAGTGSVGSVTVNSLGHIAPGVSAVGTLTNTGLTLNSGAILDFDLASTSSSDLISMSTSILALYGQQFSDFHFTALDGFGAGIYTLIDAGAISGDLGDNLTGYIGDYSATLSKSNNDIILTVVPEPGTWLLLATACIGLFVRKRMKEEKRNAG
jgi:autotransporter-associated beta strand protein